jgi:hypothetical protein
LCAPVIQLEEVLDQKRTARAFELVMRATRAADTDLAAVIAGRG